MHIYANQWTCFGIDTHLEDTGGNTKLKYLLPVTISLNSLYSWRLFQWLMWQHNFAFSLNDTCMSLLFVECYFWVVHNLVKQKCSKIFLLMFSHVQMERSIEYYSSICGMISKKRGWGHNNYELSFATRRASWSRILYGVWFFFIIFANVGVCWGSVWPRPNC